MIQKVRKALIKHNMIISPEITVAVSGGADSVALLHILNNNSLKKEFNYTLSAAHFNHKLRGVNSETDEIFVKQLCLDMGIECSVDCANVADIALKEKQSVELAARNCRYKFLQSVAKGVVATAHTASDTAETVLFNMIRGTGIAGICGVPPVREGIIRPLIYCTRQDIIMYCKQNNLQFRTDESNHDEQYSRNKLRLSVIPKLQEINQKSIENISLLTQRLGDDNNFLLKTAHLHYKQLKAEDGINLSGFTELHPAIKTRVIAELIKDTTKLTIDSRIIEDVMRLIDKGRGRCDLSQGYSALLSGGVLRASQSVTKKFRYSIDNSFSGDYGKYSIQTILVNDIKTDNVNSLFLKSAIDCDKITGKLMLRSRAEGDCFSSPQRKVTKTVKKLFIEQKIPFWKRNDIAVLADDNGLLWLEDFGSDERAKISQSTKKALIICLKGNEY